MKKEELARNILSEFLLELKRNDSTKITFQGDRMCLSYRMDEINPPKKVIRHEIFWFEYGFINFRTIVEKPKKMRWLRSFLHQPVSEMFEVPDGSGENPLTCAEMIALLNIIPEAFLYFDDSPFAISLYRLASEKAKRKARELDAD